MNLPNQTQRKGERCEAIKAISHCSNVVNNLLNIVGKISHVRIKFVGENIVQGALRSLDLRAENGFPSDVHCDEKFGVQQCFRNTIKATDRLIRCRK